MSQANTTENITIDTKRLDANSLDEQSQKLDGLSTEEILRWAASTFHKRIAVLSAFQKAGCVLCHQIYKLGLQDKVDVIFIDTGVNFQETLDTVDKFRTEHGLNIVTLHPELTMAEQTKKEGVLYISKAGQEKCCALRKKVPLKKIKGKYEALLSSLHRAAGGMRKNVPVLALDVELNLVRVHPMVHMTTDEIEDYIKREDVVYNPLHDQGYPTVSCTRCTTPVLPGEEERAGRWRHLENASQYCNINPTDRKDAGDNTAFVELRYETVEKILHYDI